MAKKTEVVLIDDIDGGEANDTVTFGLDGFIYTIDVSLEHERELREGIAKFVGPATRLGDWALRDRRQKPRGARRAPVGANRERNKAIREWAQQQGLQVSPRGRIPDEIIAQFTKAQTP